MIGDKAVRGARRPSGGAARSGDWPAALHQLAHVQLVRPEDVPRFGKLGVMANIQPLWARSEPSVTDVAC